MNKKDKILVVCHDAGGAEIISAYVKKYIAKYNFICLAVGPAKKVFVRKKLNKYLISPKEDPKELLSDLGKIKMVLAGTSWASSIELDFIREAKEKRIKTVVYLDNWIKYRERFGYPRKNWRNYLPDEIWVGDKYANKLAKIFFKGLAIKLVPNLYFKEVKEEYIKKKKTKDKINRKGILFLSSPISSQINSFGDRSRMNFTELDILRELLDFFIKQKIKKEFTIRFHPSEKENKYDSVISQYKNKLRINKSNNKNILLDIIECSRVIGMGGMALVIAYLCNKQAISYLPNNRDFPLPFKGIIKISNVNELKKYL